MEKFGISTIAKIEDWPGSSSARKGTCGLSARPPCAAFTLMNRNCNYPRMDPDEVAIRIREGQQHLRFAAEICRYQLRMGRHVAHEHPATAASWQEPELEALARHPRVITTTCHQCMYGLVTPAEGGGVLPARKATRWMTSSRQMASRLQRICDKTHEHQALDSGRPAAAAFYPEELIAELLRGMRDTHDAEASRQEHLHLIHHQDTTKPEEEWENAQPGIAPTNFCN